MVTIGQKIVLNGYEWYGNNRLEISKDAPRGSGGVGFLIKRTVMDIYDVDVVDNSSDGIIAISLCNKRSRFKALLVGLTISSSRKLRIWQPY